MTYHITNKATHCEGDTLVLVWRVVNKNGNVMCRWTSRQQAESVRGQLLAKQRRGEL